MNTRLLLILISAVFFHSCDGVKYFCLKTVSSKGDTCAYKRIILTNSDTVSISRFGINSKKKYIMTLRPHTHDFDPDSLVVIHNSNVVNSKKIQKETSNGKLYYVFSSFSFVEGDTIILKNKNVNVLDTILLMKEKLFLD